jgi:tellurite resistance protein TerA
MSTTLGQGQSVSVKGAAGAFGEIQIKLMWSDKPGAKSATGIDLDLGCLFQLKDGYLGCVQALGNMYGSFNNEPYVELDKDDRTGGSAGETLRINGDHWLQIDRVCVFAYIYDGAPNWSLIDCLAQVLVPGREPIMVQLDNARNDRGMCAIAMLENKDNAFSVQKLNQYFRTHKDLDEHYDFGLRWEIGAKD